MLAPAKKSEHDKDEEEDQDFEEPELDRCTDEEDDEECEERTGRLTGDMTEVELACQDLSREGQARQGAQAGKSELWWAMHRSPGVMCARAWEGCRPLWWCYSSAWLL